MKKITLSEIPVIPFPEPANYIDLALKVKANGEDAKIYISGRENSPFIEEGQFFGDDKVIIIWDAPNNKYGDSFITKYFVTESPGWLPVCRQPLLPAHWCTE